MSDLLFCIISAAVFVPLNAIMLLSLFKLHKEFNSASLLILFIASLIPVLNGFLCFVGFIVVLISLVIEPPEFFRNIDAWMIKLMEDKK